MSLTWGDVQGRLRGSLRVQPVGYTFGYTFFGLMHPVEPFRSGEFPEVDFVGWEHDRTMESSAYRHPG